MAGAAGHTFGSRPWSQGLEIPGMAWLPGWFVLIMPGASRLPAPRARLGCSIKADFGVPRVLAQGKGGC